MLVTCVLSTTIYAGENCRNPHTKKITQSGRGPSTLNDVVTVAFIIGGGGGVGAAGAKK